MATWVEAPLNSGLPSQLSKLMIAGSAPHAGTGQPGAHGSKMQGFQGALPPHRSSDEDEAIGAMGASPA